jgi:hypothetical protein
MVLASKTFFVQAIPNFNDKTNNILSNLFTTLAYFIRGVSLETIFLTLVPLIDETINPLYII